MAATEQDSNRSDTVTGGESPRPTPSSIIRTLTSRHSEIPPEYQAFVRHISPTELPFFRPDYRWVFFPDQVLETIRIIANENYYAVAVVGGTVLNLLKKMGGEIGEEMTDLDLCLIPLDPRTPTSPSELWKILSHDLRGNTLVRHDNYLHSTIEIRGGCGIAFFTTPDKTTLRPPESIKLYVPATAQNRSADEVLGACIADVTIISFPDVEFAQKLVTDSAFMVMFPGYSENPGQSMKLYLVDTRGAAAALANPNVAFSPTSPDSLRFKGRGQNAAQALSSAKLLWAAVKHSKSANIHNIDFLNAAAADVAANCLAFRTSDLDSRLKRTYPEALAARLFRMHRRFLTDCARRGECQDYSPAIQILLGLAPYERIPPAAFPNLDPVLASKFLHGGESQFSISSPNIRGELAQRFKPEKRKQFNSVRLKENQDLMSLIYQLYEAVDRSFLYYVAHPTEGSWITDLIPPEFRNYRELTSAQRSQLVDVFKLTRRRVDHHGRRSIHYRIASGEQGIHLGAITNHPDTAADALGLTGWDLGSRTAPNNESISQLAAILYSTITQYKACLFLPTKFSPEYEMDTPTHYYPRLYNAEGLSEPVWSSATVLDALKLTLQKNVPERTKAQVLAQYFALGGKPIESITAWKPDDLDRQWRDYHLLHDQKP